MEQDVSTSIKALKGLFMPDVKALNGDGWSVSVLLHKMGDDYSRSKIARNIGVQ